MSKTPGDECACWSMRMGQLPCTAGGVTTGHYHHPGDELRLPACGRRRRWCRNTLDLAGFLPPSSSTAVVRLRAAAWCRILPTGGLPVKKIRSHFWASSAVVSGTPPRMDRALVGQRGGPRPAVSPSAASLTPGTSAPRRTMCWSGRRSKMSSWPSRSKRSATLTAMIPSRARTTGGSSTAGTSTAWPTF